MGTIWMCTPSGRGLGWTGCWGLAGNALEAVAQSARERLGAASSGLDRRGAGEAETYEGARSHEAERRRRTGAPAGGEAASFGWAERANKIVFAHTHQPLDGVLGPSGKCRYWNTGSWIYEPDLSSRRAYMAYLHNAWPGTAVLIDTDQDQPQLLRLREHLNPLNTMDGGRGEHRNEPAS
jgi:hypothetical protein